MTIGDTKHEDTRKSVPVKPRKWQEGESPFNCIFGLKLLFLHKNYLKNLHCVQFRICQTLEVSEYLVTIVIVR